MYKNKSFYVIPARGGSKDYLEKYKKLKGTLYWLDY